ncbi:ATP-grasp domain-containing protein [Paenibacillus rhizophilus]|uniref:ATP-grasp domain-containing protein n=1 Tax=Paenibacillus rhizophilus TaxID=1850366 RepID=A0A3N9PEJ1_9BACL|nr:ATP-grasp domain-containing protein [Paenibacillus rhizophilus]RQW13434.1 ATP-grasp domain-containing protein [Paenibacillus rhizophilus]
MRVLLIGRNAGFIKKCSVIDPEVEVFIIEEPDILRKLKEFSSPNIKEIAEVKYHDSEEYMSIVKEWGQKYRFDLVVPGFEYSVKAANESAKYLNLPRIGDRGAAVFTNKVKLRDLCAEAGIPHPRYKKITSIEELREFYNGSPIVFKPANRQASIGVIRINTEEEIASAYKETLNGESEVLIPDREIPCEYIAEDLVVGYEVSVECFVRNCKIIFINYTMQDGTVGRYFIEVGHEVPGNIPSSVTDKLYQFKSRLVEAANVNTAILHSEWKIEEGEPILIECAARMPGDYIPKLISNAYEFDVHTAYINILRNKDPHINNKHKNYILIQYFQSKPGRLKEINNLEIFDELGDKLIEYSITVQPGNDVPELTSSWKRVGYFIIKDQSHEALRKLAEKINDTVEFVMDITTGVS